MQTVRNDMCFRDPVFANALFYTCFVVVCTPLTIAVVKVHATIMSCIFFRDNLSWNVMQNVHMYFKAVIIDRGIDITTIGSF